MDCLDGDFASDFLSAQLIKIIGEVLQPDDPNLRKQSENILQTLRSDKPN